jgi:hypothetical protein
MTVVKNPSAHLKFPFFNVCMQNVYFFIQLFDSELTSLLRLKLTIFVCSTLSGLKNCPDLLSKTVGYFALLNIEHIICSTIP